MTRPKSRVQLPEFEGLCPRCQRWVSIRIKNNTLYKHINPFTKDWCENSAVNADTLQVQRRPHERLRAQRESTRALKPAPVVTTQNVLRTTSVRRLIRIVQEEGLCGHCLKWQVLIQNGTLPKHGGKPEHCPGSNKLPTRTRPRGAWKRRKPRKRVPDAEAD